MSADTVEQSDAQAEQAGKDNSPFNYAYECCQNRLHTQKTNQRLNRGNFVKLLILRVLGIQKESFYRF